MPGHSPETSKVGRSVALRRRRKKRALWFRCLFVFLGNTAGYLHAAEKEGAFPGRPAAAPPIYRQMGKTLQQPSSSVIVPDPTGTEMMPWPRIQGAPTAPGRSCPPHMRPRGLGSVPMPSKEDSEEINKFVDGIIDPKATLDLVVQRTRLMVLKTAPSRTQIADETVAVVSTISPKNLTLQGKKVGTTVLNLWFKDPKTNEEKILSYLVRVIPDPDEKIRKERRLQVLEEEIHEAFPDAAIRIYLIGDKIAVCGQAKDVAEATQILHIVRANTPEDKTNGDASKNPAPLELDPSLPNLREFLVAGGPNVINLIRVPGEQQVMLKVTVAEVNRAAARSIGLNFNIRNNQGVQVFANNTGNIFTGGGVFNGGGGGGGGGANLGGNVANAVGTGASNLASLLTNNLPVSLDNGQINLAINALKTLNYAKSLAEPNLVALNGQTASFQAGGQFPVPIISNNFNNNLTGTLGGVNFVPYGVQLTFTPYITDKDRIRLNVAAEVSTRDLTSSANVSGTNVPGLNTRNFRTTVELREGQTLAIAGLVQNNLGGDSQRVPLIGDLPLIGHLTGLSRVQAGEQELVVLITPELVAPLEQKEVPPLPGSDMFEPSDCEFYIKGRMDGRHTRDYRSPVRTDAHKIKAFREAEERYIFGPAGFCDEPIAP